MKYGFIRSHRRQFRVRPMCRVLDVNPSGFYAWLKDPLSPLAREDRRQVVGWSMQSRIHAYLVLKGLLIHSDQGSQYTGHEWQKFIEEHGLICSMSRRGNCHDNAVAESFFQLLKRERIKRRIYATRDEARADMFDYIELFCNTRRRHGYNEGLSPVQYEQKTKRLGRV